MKPITAKSIECEFDAAKEICKTLLPITDRAKTRILRYFADKIDEGGDMESEARILQMVEEALNLKVDHSEHPPASG